MSNRVPRHHPLGPHRPFAPPGITIFDTETTDLGKGYKRGAANEVFLSQVAFRKSKTGGPPDILSYYTDILEPLVKRVEAGEITPEELVTEATRVKANSPRWSQDIRLKHNVLNRVFKSHLERTVNVVRGEKLPSGVTFGPERRAVEQFIGRLKNKQTIGAWNMAFDYKIMAQASRRVGLGKEFGAAVREAGLDFSSIGSQSRLLDLSTTFKMFLYEENRRNALLEQMNRSSERSGAALVHLGDVEGWTARAAGESQEAHTQFLHRVADERGHPILGGADMGRLVERHGGFHSYFDNQQLSLQNFRRYQEWFQRHGQDFGDQLSQQAFAAGKRTPSIHFVAGWNVDVLARTMGLDTSRAHEALSDTVLEDKLSKIFGAYHRSFDEAEAEIGAQFQGNRQLTRTINQELAVLEGARARFSGVLQAMKRAGDLPPSAPANATEFWARHHFETIRHIREKASIHASQRLGLRSQAVDGEISRILAPKGARPQIIDSMKAAGDRVRFTASGVNKTLMQAFGEVSGGAQRFLATRMGQGIAAIAGIAVLDSFLPESAPAPPPKHESKYIRNPLAPPIGKAFHEYAQTRMMAGGVAQRAEVPVESASFWGSGFGTGYVDLLSDRYGPIEIKTALKGGIPYHGSPSPDQIAQTRNYIQGLGLPHGYLYHIDPSDPSNITINQVAAQGRRGTASSFRRRMPGLRAGGAPWAIYGGSGIRRGGADFQSAWNSVAAFSRIQAPIASEVIIAAREAAMAIEHVGVNTFSMGATGARAAAELLQPQPIGTKAIELLRLEKAIPDAAQRARAGGELLEQAVQNFGAFSTQSRGFRGVSIDVDARIAGQYQASGLPRPVSFAGAHIQQGMSQKRPAFYHGPRPWFDDPTRGEVEGFIKVASAGPFPITPGVGPRGRQWVPHTEVLRGRRPAHEIISMRGHPGWPASAGDFHWMEFGQLGSDPFAYGVKLTKQGQDLLGQATPTKKGVVVPLIPPIPGDPSYPEYFKAQQEGRWVKPWQNMRADLRGNVTRAIGWDNLPLAIRREAEAAGFTPNTFEAAIQGSKIGVKGGTVGDSLHFLPGGEDLWETDTTTANRALHGSPSQPASKIGERITTKGEIRAARIFLGSALADKKFAVMSPRDFMQALVPGGALSRTKLDGALITPFGNNLTQLRTSTRAIIAQIYLNELKAQGLRPGIAKDILRQYGLLDKAIEGELFKVSESAIKKARGQVTTKAAETVDDLMNKAATAGKSIKDFVPEHVAYSHVLGKHHTRFKGSFIQKAGMAFKEGWLDVLFHRTWRVRGMMKKITEEKFGGRIKFSWDLEDIKRPDKGLRRWLFDHGSEWATKGTGPLAKLGRSMKYMGGAKHLGMTGLWLGMGLYSAWGFAKEYKSQTVGFSIETAKSFASLSIYQAAQHSLGTSAMAALAKRAIKIPFVDHLVAMGVSMVMDGIIHSVTDTVARAFGLKKEQPQAVPTASQYYMGNFPGLDDSQYLGQHGINPGFGPNNSGFGSGWTPPAQLVTPPTVVPSIVRRQIPRQANGGLVQHLWKHRSAGGRMRSDHLPPAMMNSGVIAA